MDVCTIRPHHSTTYVDAAYCYRSISVVCLSVCLSDCLSVGLYVTQVSPAKTAQPIKMPFGLRTGVGPRNHVLDAGPYPLSEVAIWRGKGVPIVKYRTSCRVDPDGVRAAGRHLDSSGRLLVGPVISDPIMGRSATYR